MHSKIYQISTTPIDKCNYIEEDDYYDHWFTNSIADYVSENTDRDDDIKWLEDCLCNEGLSFGTDNNGEYFIVSNKAKYFESKFEEFKKMLKELSNATFDDFIGYQCDSQMYRLREVYEDKFGFYVDQDGDLMVFDEFIRRSHGSEKYYIGATIDYHF